VYESSYSAIGSALRYHRLRGGYRREDVDEALGELRIALRSVEQDLEAWQARSMEVERQLEEARAELDAYRTREGEIEQAVETAAQALTRASRIDAVAQERSGAIADAATSLRRALGDLERAVSQLLPRDEEAGGRPIE
jgi:chromosome segregation ATPase